MFIEKNWKDKALFTPGPLTTSRTVKQAMLRDLGSRDVEFIEMVKAIRRELTALGGDVRGLYEAIILQGSGTFGIESVLGSVTPPDGKWLFLVSGSYGQRMADIAGVLKIDVCCLGFPENERVDLGEVERVLGADAAITHVGMVHCETSTGMFHPIAEVGALARRFGKQFFVDAMSSFGAVPIDLAGCGIDYLVSSANKCIEGVPGFSFVLARREVLLRAEGYARSVTLDLLAQFKGLEKNGQFRFTPPTHALLAFATALSELEEEGGVSARAERYKRNHELLVAGMRELGFREYLAPGDQGYIITSFLYPESKNFSFEKFYAGLSDQGFLIYPGKVSKANCFRIGTIGRLFAADIKNLLTAIGATNSEK